MSLLSGKPFVWFVWLLSCWLVTQPNFKITSWLPGVNNWTFAWMTGKQLKSQWNQSSKKSHHEPPCLNNGNNCTQSSKQTSKHTLLKQKRLKTESKPEWFLSGGSKESPMRAPFLITSSLGWPFNFLFRSTSEIHKSVLPQLCPLNCLMNFNSCYIIYVLLFIVYDFRFEGRNRLKKRQSLNPITHWQYHLRQACLFKTQTVSEPHFTRKEIVFLVTQTY